MATHVRPGSNRRQAMRVPVHGHAVLHGEGAVIHGVIHDLSLGGASIDVRSRPVLGRADWLGVELHLPATRQVRLRAQARRVERRDHGLRVAISFTGVEADAEDAIDDAVITAYTSAQRRRVLVVDGIEERRLDIADALRGRAMTPLTPRTPLEVIGMLSDGGQRVDVCAVGNSFADLAGGTIAAVVKDAFPWVRIVAIRDDAAAVASDADDAWRDLEERCS